jgi:hypothetical protein
MTTVTFHIALLWSTPTPKFVIYEYERQASSLTPARRMREVCQRDVGYLRGMRSHESVFICCTVRR